MNLISCDYEALKSYAITLNKDFNTIRNAISHFENAMEIATGFSVWDSPTREYYLDLYNSLKENFEIIFDKFNNINQYLDTVIDNYKSAEEQMSSFF